jgi:hypothetical protein
MDLHDQLAYIIQSDFEVHMTLDEEMVHKFKISRVGSKMSRTVPSLPHQVSKLMWLAETDSPHLFAQ